MKKSLTWILLLIFLPEVALANLILPTLVVTMPIMWVSLVAVIVVEVLVLNYLWPEAKIKSIIISTGIGNCVSTLVGVPVAWVLYYFGITLPVMIFSDLFFEIAMKLPQALVVPIGFIVGAPIIMDMNDCLGTYVQFLLMLPGAYFLSYWIESIFFNIEGIDSQNTLRGVRIANRVSYLFVLLIVTICFLFMAGDKNSWLTQAWYYILHKASYIALLMPW